jgi:hypothetical protein
MVVEGRGGMKRLSMVQRSGTGYIAKSRSRQTKRKLGIVGEESAAPNTDTKQKAGPPYLPSPDRHLRSEAWYSRVAVTGTLRRRVVRDGQREATRTGGTWKRELARERRVNQERP